MSVLTLVIMSGLQKLAAWCEFRVNKQTKHRNTLARSALPLNMTRAASASSAASCYDVIMEINGSFLDLDSKFKQFPTQWGRLVKTDTCGRIKLWHEVEQQADVYVILLEACMEPRPAESKSGHFTVRASSQRCQLPDWRTQVSLLSKKEKSSDMKSNMQNCKQAQNGV